jgi:hypothetical protein
MTGKNLGTGFLVVAAGLLTGISAFADDTPDPALFQDAPANSSCTATSYWCTSAGAGVDPNTKDSTLEFILNAGSPGTDGITTPFGTGWVEFKDTASNSILDYLDFVIVNGKDTIFLYCNNAYCGSNDAGLPSITPSNPIIVDTVGSTGNGSSHIVQWTSSSPAGSSGPVYVPCTPGAKNTGNPVVAVCPQTPEPGYAAAFFGSPVKNQGTAEYGIVYAGNTVATGKKDVPVPEPSALMLLASMMIGLAAFVRSKFSARA